MDIKWHVAAGFIASSTLVFFFNFSLEEGLIIFAASVLIDIDHYFWYALSTKDFNPFNALKWHYKTVNEWRKVPLKVKMGEYKLPVYVFHGVLFWAVLYALSLNYPIFLLILFGFFIHLICDWPFLVLVDKEPLRIKFFPEYVFWKNKGKKCQIKDFKQ